ncbi:hypothetical protein AAVH_36093 [Aphelenchoides avenae]|nr:hypothetical protein AAVH_36093 [Aphelenchus avenae]
MCVDALSDVLANISRTQQDVTVRSLGPQLDEAARCKKNDVPRRKIGKAGFVAVKNASGKVTYMARMMLAPAVQQDDVEYRDLYQEILHHTSPDFKDVFAWFRSQIADHFCSIDGMFTVAGLSYTEFRVVYSVFERHPYAFGGYLRLKNIELADMEQIAAFEQFALDYGFNDGGSRDWRLHLQGEWRMLSNTFFHRISKKFLADEVANRDLVMINVKVDVTSQQLRSELSEIVASHGKPLKWTLRQRDGLSICFRSFVISSSPDVYYNRRVSLRYYVATKGHMEKRRLKAVRTQWEAAEAALEVGDSQQMAAHDAESERLKAEGILRNAARAARFQPEIGLPELEWLDKFEVETILDIDEDGNLLAKWKDWDSKFNTYEADMESGVIKDMFMRRNEEYEALLPQPVPDATESQQGKRKANEGKVGEKRARMGSN